MRSLQEMVVSVVSSWEFSHKIGKSLPFGGNIGNLLSLLYPENNDDGCSARRKVLLLSVGWRGRLEARTYSLKWTSNTVSIGYRAQDLLTTR